MAGDTPGVVAPPPLVFLGGLLAGLALDRVLPVAGTGLSPAPRAVLAAAFLAAGASLLAAALLRFRRAGTRPEPWQPSTVFVASGIYRLTRNPMYLGMALASLGVALLLDSPGAVLTLPPTLLVIQRGVILREERYLDARFGEDYRRYRARVRRWL